VFYTVDNPSKYWVGGEGYISKDMALKGLPAPSDDTLILVSSRPFFLLWHCTFNLFFCNKRISESTLLFRVFKV